MKRITSRYFGIAASAFLAAALASPIASADDADDVRAVIDTYLATEATDLRKQAGLMTDDRTFIAGGARQTDNVANMKSQMAGAAVNKELDPDATVIVTGEDVMIRVIGGNAAVASFYRYWNVISSADSVREGRDASGPPNDAVTLVLAKMGGDWKIVHTHQSPIVGLGQ
jgi:ketosteroid isomerase-like protein